MAVTVPRFGPEAVNWALSNEYHDVPGGHVRIYRRSTLVGRLRRAGLRPARQPPRPRPALPLLVGALPGGTAARRPSRRAGLPPAARLGHHECPPDHPDHRAPPQSPARKEPRRLSGEAGMTRTEGTFPAGPRRCQRRVVARRSPRWPCPCRRCRGADGVGGGGDGRFDRRGPAPRRDDPVVRRWALRPLEPRRVGHGPDRRGIPQGGHCSPTSGWPTASSPTVRGSTTTWPVRGEGPPPRHECVRLRRHRGVAPLPGDGGQARCSRPCGP